VKQYKVHTVTAV